MKKSYLLFCIALFITLNSYQIAFSEENTFADSLAKCKRYSQSQDIIRGGQPYGVTASLESKGNTCIYKETIKYGFEESTLNCTFPKSELPILSKSMKEYREKYQKQIAKEKIFEAKMTNNPEIVEKYLARPQYCTIIPPKTK